MNFTPELLFLSIIGFAFTGFALFELKKGAVYSFKGFTRLSGYSWISKEASPTKFWITCIGHFVIGLLSFFAVLYEIL